MVTQTRPSIDDVKSWLNSDEINSILAKHLSVETGNLNPFTGVFKPGKPSDYKNELEHIKNSLLESVKAKSREHYPMVRIGHDLIVGVHVEDWKLFFIIDTSSQGFVTALNKPEYENVEIFDIPFSLKDWVKKYKNRLKFAKL